MSHTPERLQQVQRRTLSTLVVSQSLGGVGITLGIAVASILAKDITGNEELAGLAQTFQVLGAAVASFLLAHLMSSRGRRVGLTLGYLLGAIGALLCVVAGVTDTFPTMLLGAALLGSTTAANLQARYAATDLARPEHRARSLSLVVWATTIGAVAGPNLTGPAGGLAERVGLPRLTGPFAIAFVGMVLAAVAVATLMRPDPLLVAREAALASAHRPRTERHWSRVWAVVRHNPGVGAGIAGLALAHAVMVSVMIMTPLHMQHGAATLEIIGLVVSVHVFGMYAFAPFVGMAADRFGRRAVLGAGSAVLLTSLLLAGTSPTGASWRIGAGLFLLGVGWSLSSVSASALLSESAPIDARTDIQGAADLVMNLTAAAGGALAGVIVGTLGYAALNAFAAVFAAGVLVAALLGRRPAAAVEQDEAPLAL